MTAQDDKTERAMKPVFEEIQVDEATMKRINEAAGVTPELVEQIKNATLEEEFTSAEEFKAWWDRHSG